MTHVVVAITGASGVAYGVKLIEELLKREVKVDVTISATAYLIIADELGLKLGTQEDVPGQILKHLGLLERYSSALNYYPAHMLTAPMSSGSALRRTMVIAPCSMGTLGRISAGVSHNLIDRTADCILKERGTLVLVPRETPLNAIHLENMLKLTHAGAVILPAMPAFYTNPETIEDMVGFVVGKVLDVMGLENDLYKRWEGEE